MLRLQLPISTLSSRYDDIRHNSRGFTIVELLVVIVTIAILASITIVAYNGVQNRANDAVVQSDLRHTYDKLQIYQIDNLGSYPLTTDTTTLQSTFVATKGSYNTSVNAYIYCRSNTAAAVMAASKSKTGYFYSSVSGQGTVAAATWGTGANATLCPLAGIQTSDAGYSFYWFYTTASGWTW